MDPGLAQYAYLVGCRQTNKAVIIDPERDVDRYVNYAAKEGMTIVAVAETHIHADFLSGAREFADRYGTMLYLSDEGPQDWKYEWVKSGRYAHILLRNGDSFHIGKVEFETVHTPGHTPEHLSFLVTDHGAGADEPMGILSGDFVFVGDVGRPDLLETAAGIKQMMRSSARELYVSARAFLDLPDYLQVWPGHGAGSACGKALGAVPETTVGYERRFSPAIDAVQKGEDAFVEYVLENQQEPPLYFARMKRQNRDGVALLGEIVKPPKLSAEEVAGVAATRGALRGQGIKGGEAQKSADRRGAAAAGGANPPLILDTRVDPAEFAAQHLPGTLHAPLNSSFSSFVGSLIADENTPLYLVADEGDVDETVRRLARIGYDKIVGYAAFLDVSKYLDDSGEAARMEVIDFDELERQRHNPDVEVYDVRFASEYRAGHVPGAIHESYTRLPEKEDSIPSDKTILVHCASGIRATAAAAYLARSGRSVKVVIDEWSNYAELYETASETSVGAA